jgi:WD40 repeat protein
MCWPSQYRLTPHGAGRLCLRGHPACVTDVAFAPDGTLTVTTSGDQAARIWSATDLSVYAPPSPSIMPAAILTFSTLKISVADNTAPELALFELYLATAEKVSDRRAAANRMDAERS